VLCWKTSKEEALKVLRDFINDTLVIELDQDIKFKTADIRKAHRIKLPDAIIAATANVYQLTLITRNVSDFDGISGLEIMNPWEK
jgi:predicted nucleic acid-binding protein